MKAFLLFCGLLLATILQAQDFRFWVGRTNSNWNEPGNWALVSQGLGGASVPGATSRVVFDWASPPNDCVLDVDAEASFFSMSNGSFSAGAFSLTVDNDFVLSGGTLSLSTGALNAIGTTTISGGAFNVESGTLTVFPGTFTLSGGILNGNTGTIRLGGAVSVQSSGLYNKGTSTLILNGVADQVVTVSYTAQPHVSPLYKLIINKPGTTVFFPGTTADTVDVEDSIILVNGQLSGTGNLKAEGNVWVQNGFDGSGLPLTFTGSNNSVMKLDTIYASLLGSHIIVKKASALNTVSFIKTNTTDTIREGNKNGNLTINQGILQFPDNPPVESFFKIVFIETGGTLRSTSNYFYNGGSHINEGGVFLHNNGTYVFNQPSVPAVTAITNDVENFNNLIIDLGGGQFSPTANDTLVANGDLTFRGGLITGGSSSAFDAKGNVSFEAGMDPTQTQTSLIFSGAGTQNMTFASGTEDYWNANVRINKPSGSVVLQSPMILDENSSLAFTFTSGVVTATTTNYLSFANGYNATGASNASYVDGPVHWQWVAATFDFPVGNGGFYAPVRITNAQDGDIFSAQYFHQASPNAGGPKEITLSNISQKEWWQVNRLAGSSTPTPFLWLSYDNVRSGGVTNPAELRIARWDDGIPIWQDKGNDVVDAPFIRSNNTITDFSPFTLASTNALDNPLPVTLVSFNVMQQGKDALLLWRTSSELNSDHFDVESSINGSDFAKIGEVKAAGNSNAPIDYNSLDVNIVKYNSDRIYYRLKQVDIDGKFSYSDIKMLKLGARSQFVKVYPVPFRDKLIIDLPEGWNGQTAISLFDMSGRLMYRGNQTISSSQSNIVISNLPLLAGGSYVLILKNGENEAIQKVVKE